MSNTHQAIDTIYKARKRFAIIGLTGRTGSGCSTVAREILSKEHFSELPMQEPKETDFSSSEERKYRVIYRYAQVNWLQFKVIRMSDIIASFVFQQGKDKLREYLDKCPGKISSTDSGQIIIDELYEKIGNISGKINLYIDPQKTNSLKRDAPEDYKQEVDLLNEIRALADDFKDSLKKVQCEYTVLKPTEDDPKHTEKCTADCYTHLFQTWGNNIRACGDPFVLDKLMGNKEEALDNAAENHFTGKNMFDIARRANDFIKAIRRNQSENDPCLICIDALRNPYEVTYFKDRYASFYLMSVNTDDAERKHRLAKNGLSKDQIDALDTTEYPQKPKGAENFYLQNIAACLQLADIHLYNPHREIEKHYFLTEQVVRYIMLIFHPGLVTPTPIERCMQTAYNAKVNSGCLSRQVGAVITDKNYSVKAIGWNDVPEGQVPCNLRDLKSYCINRDKNSHSAFEIEDEKFSKALEDKWKALNKNDYSNTFGGRLYPYCFKDIYNRTYHTEKNQVNTRALHAEENAFLQLAKYGGMGIQGGFLFVTASPCELCSKKAYQLGITKIYYIDPYPGISAKHILTFGYDNPHNPKMILFYGAIGHAYTSLYAQRIPYKDELKLLEC